MSTDTIMIELKTREVLGKQVRQLRQEGLVPAVIHNHGKESMHVMAPYVSLLKTYQQAGKNHPVEVKVGDKTMLTLIKQASFRPPKNDLLHIVFQSVKQNEKVEAEVPIQFVGTPPAEQVGLVVLHQLDHVVIEAFPRDLPDHIEINAELLKEAGDKLTVADMVMPANVTLITEPEHTVATVVEPRAIAAEEAEETAEGDNAEASKEESEEE